MKTITAAVLGAGGRGREYAQYALDYPGELRIAAVAEPDATRREAFADLHGIDASMRFDSWEALLAGPRVSDAVLICTQDRMHYEPAVKALELGYHVLLEKPMSNDPGECVRLGEYAERTGQVFAICHVLRYTPFFSTIKRLLGEGRIGDPVTIDLIENVGYWHQAHSFVRGNWRRADESNPMILAKSCHDLDILVWLAGADCASLSSYGGLRHFREENAPVGAPYRCLDGCPVSDECPYYAPDIYLNNVDKVSERILRGAISHDTSTEGVLEALRTGPYGRCVYRCDNDVVDHQVVAMEFANGVTATFTMTAFTTDGGRTLKIMGTRGQLRAHMAKNTIEISDFKTGRVETIDLESTGLNHGGGDRGIMRDFARLVRGEGSGDSLSSAAVSVQSHMMAFAAEKSRLERQAVPIRALMASVL
ncbi:Gfo/Idh/MocA family protein [Cohnella sp. JJ-181]|uniref:Gfo/Idh/MocA family protein n=1 Tax=Cohnella rhizoplanae TaxID=2974897 RepID=UPI0022FFA0B8|nr:Gfo/Idh/MocA family oxidoreductase [Cohnella sp. JJ-181]CAI6080814.1 Inositol 2-dehydrogenase/D-chiro-inositol 3-dehydrogenase [Cohnella sp. JJ-181]